MCVMQAQKCVSDLEAQVAELKAAEEATTELKVPTAPHYHLSQQQTSTVSLCMCVFNRGGWRKR